MVFRRRGIQLDKFWAHVDYSTGLGPNGTCWEWRGWLTRQGYGQYKSKKAHRIVWELLRGPIPPGLVSRHFACSNRRCVNPDHIAMGTMRENYEDMLRDGTAIRGVTCGTHKLTEEQVASIRAQRGKRNATSLAAEYGVHYVTINRIFRGDRWRHLLAARRPAEEAKP